METLPSTTHRPLWQHKGHLAALVLAFACVVGCKSADKAYVGKWNGGFETDQKADSWQGYLQIYATNDRFALHLDGPSAAIDMAGTWSLKGHRFTLTSNDFKLDDLGGHKGQVPSDAIRTAYQRPLVLDLDEQGTTLTGLRMSMGGARGVHRFAKVDMRQQVRP